MAFLSELSTMPVKVGLVYLLIYLLFPTGRQRAWWNTVLSVMLLWAVAVVIRRAIIVHFTSPVIFASTTLDQPLLTIELIYYSVFELFPVVGVAIALKAYRQRLDWREREKNLVKEKLESELNFLKAQINPHFLFNTLNNIYALARKQSEKTSDAVLKLSKLMRFMLYEAPKSRIPLSEEIRLIGDYIELEKLRYSERLQVEFNSSVDDKTQEIAPLILIHFVENAFKHGASESRFQSRIAITTKLDLGILKASFVNTIENADDDQARVRIGLANIKRQLELLYPNHTIEVKQEPDSYSVQLTIPLRTHAKD